MIVSSWGRRISSLLVGWVALSALLPQLYQHHGSFAWAFWTSSVSSHSQRPFTGTSLRYDSETHDWDVLQKKLQQKIQEHQQFEQQQIQTQTQSQARHVRLERELPTPSVDYSAQDVVTMCMDHLQDNHVPVPNAGLQVCFDFSSDRCRAACGGTLQDFVEYAANPVFGMLLYCDSWKILSIGPIIAGTPTRGAMQTVLIEVQAASAPSTSISQQQQPLAKSPKRFLWTLQQERRPPRQGCWLVHEVMFTKNAFALTM